MLLDLIVLAAVGWVAYKMGESKGKEDRYKLPHDRNW